ncbi:MAG: hypothetical protein H6719_37085 [Sandaracinaceae bacterium]|nr:hypothetical protein [Sandaracinaceae bacterium]
MRSGPLRVAAALVVGAWLAGGASSARAQDPFEAAETARAEARLEDASAAYTRVLESGELGLSEVAHAHLRLAEIAFLGEEIELGTRHLGYALALRPDAPVTDGPQAMQDAAAAILVERSQRRLRAVLEISDPSAPIVLDVRDAPAGLVRTIEVRGPGGWSRTFAWDGEARSLEPPAESRPLGVRLLDAYGNALGSAGVWPAAAPAAPPAEVIPPVALPTPAEPEPEEEEGDNVFENPWLWVAIGVVLVVAGVAIGFTASGDSYVVGAPVAP